ncbi:MAG: GNAT family N-acetyltransferase [Bacteroidales bacterium]|nr:GNAT family N-acetyltransferase [Bacteroidales bacterium]
MFIRLASNSDTEQIIKLIETCYAVYDDKVNTMYYDKDLLDIEGKYLTNNGVFYVADKDFRILGTIALKPVDEKEAEIKRFYVHPDFWGDGTADLLFSYVLNYAKNSNIKKISLWTDERYERAQAFYKKVGFVAGESKDMEDADNPYTLVYYEFILK